MKPVSTIRRDGLLILFALGSLAVVVGLSRWIDAHRPPSDPTIEEEKLYVTGNTVKRVSLGFNGLAADWYWMRSLQYVGGKILKLPGNVQLDNLGQLDLKLLAPLLDTATTLDPDFMEPYEYAAIVLPGVDVQEAIRITRKGIAANPSAWRLYQHLGYIYWQQKDFQAAAETYSEGAKIPGVPAWMEAMKARMAFEGGSRNTAREIYQRMYEQAGDDKVKEMARQRLMQLYSQDEREALREVLTAHKSRVGRCPASWREVSLQGVPVKVDAGGSPVDPSGAPYRLMKDKCDVELDAHSQALNW